MTLSFLKPVLRTAQTVVACGIAAFSLNGCGSGSGSSDAVQIAPSSLDGLKLEMYGGFNLTFARLAGKNGTENGAVDYDALRQTFRVGVNDPGGLGGSTGRDVIIPGLLEQVTYNYERTSPTTGLITLTWVNIQLYPHSPATEDNPTVAEANLFWGAPDNPQTSLTLEVLFVDAGGVINDTTIRLRDVWYYTSVFGVGTSVVPLPVDSTTIRVSLNGGRLLTNNEPLFSPDEPSSVVFPDLRGRTIDLVGNSVFRKIAHQTSGAQVLEIPGEDSVDDAGTLLVSINGNVLPNPSGIFSYVRTGGDQAELAIRYNQNVEGENELIRVDYVLTFTSFDGGTFVDSNGDTGTFSEDNFTNQP